MFEHITANCILEKKLPVECAVIGNDILFMFQIEFIVNEIFFMFQIEFIRNEILFMLQIEFIGNEISFTLLFMLRLCKFAFSTIKTILQIATEYYCSILIKIIKGKYEKVTTFFEKCIDLMMTNILNTMLKYLSTYF